MINSYNVKELGYYLNSLKIDAPKVEQTKNKSHQYIIIDRSGSMDRNIHGVIDIIKKYVSNLDDQTRVSLGYFSGNNQYNLSSTFELKQELSPAINVLDSYDSTMGLTNYIQILEKINREIKSQGTRCSLYFFTDGYHNQGGSFSRVLEILKDMSPSLDIVSFVGCGYIDRDNMNEMAEVANGSFTHIDEFSKIQTTLENFKDGVLGSAPTVQIELPADAFYPCSLINGNIINYTTTNNKIEVKYSVNDSTIQVYYMSYKPIDKISKECCERTFRTLASVLVSKNKVPDAMKVLAEIGDKYLLRKLDSSFTPDEIAVVNDEIIMSITSSKKRYQEGIDSNYLPDPNALCVLDLLQALAEDKKVLCHLNDKEFEYKRIGKILTQTDGSKIIYPEDINAKPSKLVMNEERLNVSLSTNYKAHVPIDATMFTTNPFTADHLKKLGLKDGYKQAVTVFRTYNIIADGVLQTKKLVVSKIGKKFIKKFSKILSLRDDGRYVLDISSLPIINKSYGSNMSATRLANLAWKQHVLQDRCAVLRSIIKTLNLQDTTEPIDASVADFLKEHCYIKNGSYSPPVKYSEGNDVYKAYSFKISIDGFSKASASSVIKKILENKKVTQRESIIEYYYNQYKNMSLENAEKEFDNCNEELQKVRHELQSTKFAVIMIAKGSMPEFNDRNNMKIIINTQSYITLPNLTDVTVTFDIKQIEVQI